MLNQCIDDHKESIWPQMVKRRPLSGGDRTWEQPSWLTTDKETLRLFLSWFIPQWNTLQYGNDKFHITADLLIEFSYSGLIFLYFNMLAPYPIKRISALSTFTAFWAFHPLIILLCISCFSHFSTTICHSALSFLNILKYKLLMQKSTLQQF